MISSVVNAAFTKKSRLLTERLCQIDVTTMYRACKDRQVAWQEALGMSSRDLRYDKQLGYERLDGHQKPVSRSHGIPGLLSGNSDGRN
jgi:hypothetical protein